MLNEIDNFDLVLVYKLDRLTRSVKDLLEILELFENKNVLFRSATEVYDTTSAMGRLFVTLVGAMAEWERTTIQERTAMGRRSYYKLEYEEIKLRISEKTNSKIVKHNAIFRSKLLLSITTE